MFLKKGYVLHNRYEIIEKIGAGGMSIVYKAEDLHLKRKVAIKVLRDEFVEDDEFIKRFRREAESVALLNHPNIVNVYDSSVDGDINFIVMEYLNGQNLEEIVSKVGKIDVNAALTILYNIAEALSYAHKNGIIHRDLKAKNVVINEEGTVKVADFGIAKATSTNTISVATNAIGSVYYYSPEMAKGEECDERSDIYSFGMLGYELITGKHAFDGDTPVQVALKQVTDVTPKPSELCGCSMSVDYLIQKATEKNPKDRYQNAYELIKDIDAILDGKDITKKVQMPERDEVSNFAKILDEYNEVKASEERKEHIEETKKEQSKSLDELHKLNAPDSSDEVALMEDGITFKYMNEAERRDIERKEKIDKILNKFKPKKEEKFEDYVAKDEPILEEEKQLEEIKRKPGYISLTDVDENMFSNKDESYHNEYESSKEVKKESSSMSARELAAAELFDDREDDDKSKKQFEKDTKENVSKPEKKKKSLRDFFTIDVDEEDDFEDEKDLKHEEDEMAKSRDDYGYISKDDDKQVVKAAIYTSLVIIFFILIGMIRYMMYLYDNRLVEVPELVGEVYEEVADTYKKQGIQIEVIGEEVNMRYAKGVIISQENDPGSKMNRKNVIGVVLSKGKSGSVMPDLISRTVEEAKEALEKYEVSILVAEEASNDVVEGYIARTEPACDEPIRQGMTVTLYLSTGGDAMFTVPDLTGMTEKEAKAALEKVGLKLGNVVYRDGSNESNGVVTSQTELANTKLDEDAEVGIGLDVKENEPSEDTKPKDENNKPQEDTKPQTPVSDNVLVSAKVVAQSWMVDGQSYVVEIRIDDNPEYRQKINKADFPITQKFNAKKGQILTVYIDGKYITEKICE